MENLSFAHRLDHEPATSSDETAYERSGSRADQSVSIPPPAYRAESLIDGLRVYATVFGCSAGCGTASA